MIVGLLFCFLWYIITPLYSFIMENINYKKIFKNKVNIFYFLYFISLPFLAIILSKNSSATIIPYFPVLFYLIILFSLITYLEKNNKFYSSKIFLFLTIIDILLGFWAKMLNNGSGSIAWMIFSLILLLIIIKSLIGFFYLLKLLTIIFKNYIDPAIKNNTSN